MKQYTTLAIILSCITLWASNCHSLPGAMRPSNSDRIFACLDERQESAPPTEEVLASWVAQADLSKATDASLETVLQRAVRQNNIGVVRAILSYLATQSPEKKAAVLEAKNPTTGYASLHYAIRYNHEEIFMLLMDAGVNFVQTTQHTYQYPLHLAASFGTPEMVHRLLTTEQPNNVYVPNHLIDLRDHHTYTPLAYAVQRHHMEIIRILLGAKASIHLGMPTPLHLALQRQDTEVLQLFARSYQILQARYFAPTLTEELQAQLSNPEQLKVYCQAHELTQAQKNTALFQAAEAGSVDSVLYLISQGANPWVQTTIGKLNLAHIALMFNRHALMRCLMRSEHTKVIQQQEKFQTVQEYSPFYGSAYGRADTLLMLANKAGDAEMVALIKNEQRNK